MPRGVYKLYQNVGGRGQEWPDAVVSTLQTEIPLGMSASKLVDILRTRHAYNTTRNAIIGKAYRLGLAFTTRMNNEGAVKAALKARKQDRRLVPKAPKPKNVKPVEERSLLRDDGSSVPGNTGTTFRRRRRSMQEIEVARKGHIPAIVESAPDTSKPFGDLNRHECRWPTANDASMACGARATIGSYCDKHAVLAYRTMPTRKRNASITKVQDIDKGSRYDAEADATIRHFLSVGITDVPRITGDDAVDAFIAEHVIDD